MGAIFPGRDYSKIGYIFTPPFIHVLPTYTQSVSVTIAFFTEKKLYETIESSFYTTTLNGARINCDSILLEKRIFIGPYSIYTATEIKDLVVSIEIDGNVILPPQKVKRDNVRQMGVCPVSYNTESYFDNDHFYIDRIMVPCHEIHGTAADIEAACEFLISGNKLTCPVSCTNKGRLLSMINVTHQVLSDFLDTPDCDWVTFGINGLLPYTSDVTMEAVWYRGLKLLLQDINFGQYRDHDSDIVFFQAMMTRFNTANGKDLLLNPQFTEQYPNCADGLRIYIEQFDSIITQYQRVHRGAMATMRVSLGILKDVLAQKGFDLYCEEKQHTREYFSIMMFESVGEPFNFYDCDIYGLNIKNPSLPNFVQLITARCREPL
jgi:hypothetical protein